jgi:hypothetical protein
MHLQRYLTSTEFARELRDLRAYSYVNDELLQQLEHTKLLVPRRRLRLPDSIARRRWFEAHADHVQCMNGDLEPDGARWDAANALLTSEYRWSRPSQCGESQHPFDYPEERFQQFLVQPDAHPFVPWNDLRCDVGNDVHPVLFDGSCLRSYYSSWQLLLAAEVASAGVHFLLNLNDAEVRTAVDTALDEGRLLPGGHWINFRPIYAVRGFAQHEPALDAVVWYGEEGERHLAYLLREQSGGRFRLTRIQDQQDQDARKRLAGEALHRYGTSAEAVVDLCQYLAERWCEWEDCRRPAISEAYKSVLWHAVQLLLRIDGLSLDAIRERVGFAGGWNAPILDKIWPSWIDQEKQRVVRTLQALGRDSGRAALQKDDLIAFVDFLSSNGLEAFFWRLRSFEEHAFGSNKYSLAAMKADLEGLSICVEHLAGILGAVGTQLFEKLKSLWKEPSVAAILLRNSVSQLAKQSALAKDWAKLKSDIGALRAEPGGDVAADLVLAHRIRGGVHDMLPESDHLELEYQFVTLLRAAALTFLEVERVRNEQAI